MALVHIHQHVDPVAREVFVSFTTELGIVLGISFPVDLDDTGRRQLLGMVSGFPGLMGRVFASGGQGPDLANGELIDLRAVPDPGGLS